MAKPVKPDLYQLMSGDLSNVAKANNVLTRHWLLLLVELKIKAPTWEILFTKYHARKIKTLGKKAADELKGNLPKRLAAESVSWRFFCEGISVLDFEKAVYVVRCFRNGEQKEFGINIAPDETDQPKGKLLRTLWDMINAAYPECAGDAWKKLIRKYLQRYQARKGKTPDWLSGNLKRGFSGDTFTWNIFHKGLCIFDFDKIELEIIVKSRRRNPIIVPLCLYS